jgi:uncharacterized protein
VDFLAFKLYVSRLLNFCLHLRTLLPSYHSGMKLVEQNACFLEHWLSLPVASQFHQGLEAVNCYEAIIQTFVRVDDVKDSGANLIFNYAAHLGYEGVLGHMLEEGAPMDGCDKENTSPFEKAASLGHEECARLLIRAGARINKKELSIYAHTSIVKILIEERAVQKKDWARILFFAAMEGNLPTVELLIAQGVSLNVENTEGKTALMIASQQGHMHLVHHLLRSQSSLTKSDHEGRTALHLATASNHPGVVHILLKARAKLNLSHDELSEAMLTASHHGHAHLIPTFIQAGANPNVRNASGNTCLSWAAAKKQSQVVVALLKAGADPNIADADGFTPLMEAAHQSNHAMIQPLLLAGANINAQNQYGSTACMWAVEKGDLATVNTLIQAGADLTLANKQGETALTWARRYGHHSLVPVLKETMIRQFYQQLLRCQPQEVRKFIEAHRRAGVSKTEICQFMLKSETRLDRKISLLQAALAKNSQGRPSNGLSAFMHHSQGRGFRTFFSREPSYAVSVIKTELYQLLAQKRRAEVDTSPKLL